MTNQTDVGPSVGGSSSVNTKTAKTKETLSLLSTALPLIGVLGTAFVWLAANFYVGTVDIKPSAEYQEITVKVFDQKGAESQFHTSHFLLQPGKYHFAISLDDKGARHLDAEVVLGRTSNIKLIEPETQSVSSQTSSDQAAASRKHWWQFWKKSSSDPQDSSSASEKKESN
jgi:hypothetical protein